MDLGGRRQRVPPLLVLLTALSSLCAAVEGFSPSLRRLAAVRQAGSDTVLSFDAPAAGFQRYNDCRSDKGNMLDVLYRVFDVRHARCRLSRAAGLDVTKLTARFFPSAQNCFAECSTERGCPENCCMSFTGTSQLLVCEAPGPCMRYGISLTKKCGFFSLEDYTAPALPGRITCALSRLKKGNGACAIKVSLQSEELSCPGGVDVPQSGQMMDSGNCSANAPADVRPRPDGEVDVGGGADPSPTASGQGEERVENRDTSASGPSSNCFPGSAVVQTADGGARRMDKIAVGDSVHVGGGDFSEIFMFTHKLVHGVFDFVRIETAAGALVTLSHGHLLPVNGGTLVAAGAVSVGDTLQLATGAETAVLRVTNVREAGLVNPQTVHGNIVVDGVVCSTYTSAMAPEVAHAVLAPCRVAHGLFGGGCGALLDGRSAFGEALRGAWSAGLAGVVRGVAA
jgi:hypothetical protein